MLAKRLVSHLEEIGYRLDYDDSHASRFVKRSWISPVAYLHVVYHPAATPIVQSVSRRLSFPSEVSAMYESMNGASLFAGAIKIYGCVEEAFPLDRTDPLSLPPLSIVEMNRMFVPEERSQQFICIGGYSYDRSLVCIDRESDEAVCFHGDTLMQLRKSWRSLENWLAEEITRLSLLFSPEGRRLVQEKFELPDSTLHQ